MSQQQWGQPPREGAGGSVRRARERMEAKIPSGLPQQQPQRSPQQKYYEQPSQAPSPPSNHSRPQMPQALQGQGPIGVAISKTTKAPQWPLAGTIETAQDQNQMGNDQYQPPASRSLPPQRPSRPSHVPSMLDASQVQEHTTTFQYQAPRIQTSQRDQEQGWSPMRHREDEIESPSVASPIAHSSRPSTISSVGTIPDFPVPMPPPQLQPQRRSGNLGPPPSSRRGASSYYSHASYVSPIPEESPRTQPSHDSYASSAAIPTTWGSDSPGNQYDDDADFERYERDRRWETETIEEGRESRESNLEDNDDRGLIRSASVGKRAKPSMITTESSEKVDSKQRPAPQSHQKSKLERMCVLEGGLGRVTTGAAISTGRGRDMNRGTMWPAIGSPNSPLASGTGFIDELTSSSEDEVPKVARAMTPELAKPESPALETSMQMGGNNAASSLQPPEPASIRTPSPGFSRLSAIRRPLRLEIDAVREAEARGSLTSLPDLIRRATRLAAMMDRGKRPASRLNDMNDFSSMSDLAGEKEMSFSPINNRRSGLSGMLAAFPPPGLATPIHGNTPRPRSTWPVVDYSQMGQDPSQPRKKRRCCGLPCWGFVLVLLILPIIITAAVVVPLELLVIHKPKLTSLTVLQECSQNNSTACQNGGTATLTTGSCSCICINGFTGSICSVAGTSGCTTTTLSTEPSYANVTIGETIPRLIEAAKKNFSIPLFSTVILARFNAADLSCIAENALVTFDGQSERVGSANDIVSPTQTSGTSAPTSSSSSSSNKQRRDDSSPSSAAAALSTASGIVYDPGSAYTSSDSTPAATSSAASSIASANPTATFSVTEEVLDFARVAVLFVLQQEEVESAITAQTALQHFFTLNSFQNQAAQNLSLGNGNSANLLDFSINLGNGSVGSSNTSLSPNASLTERNLSGRRSVVLWTVDAQ